MRSRIVLMALLAAGSGMVGAARAGEEAGARLRVLYVGNAETERGRAYARFLGEHFRLVGAVDRKAFDPKSAEATPRRMSSCWTGRKAISCTPRRGPRANSRPTSSRPWASGAAGTSQRSCWAAPGTCWPLPGEVFGGSG